MKNYKDIELKEKAKNNAEEKLNNWLSRDEVEPPKSDDFLYIGIEEGFIQGKKAGRLEAEEIFYSSECSD